MTDDASANESTGIGMIVHFPPADSDIEDKFWQMLVDCVLEVRTAHFQVKMELVGVTRDDNPERFLSLRGFACSDDWEPDYRRRVTLLAKDVLEVDIP